MRFQPGQSGNPATQFKPGQSGNPGGRPKRQKAATELANRHTTAILESLAQKALEGDVSAAAAFLRFSLPVPKAKLPTIELGPLRTVADLQAAMDALARHIAAGELAPDEINALLAVIEHARKVVETTELAAEVQALKAAVGMNSTG